MNTAATFVSRSVKQHGVSTALPPSARRGEARPRALPAGSGQEAPELYRRVAAALIESGYAALSFIGCDVEQNRVILSGSVPSYHLKQQAQVCAQRVEGIGSIENRLVVQRRGRC